MDIKKLTRVDAGAAGIGLLIFIFSFLSYYKSEFPGGGSVNAWGGQVSPLVVAVVITPVLGAVAYVLGSLLPHIQFLGLTLKQWGLPLIAITPISALWSLGGHEGIEMGVGGIFIVLLTIALAGVVIAGEFVPALKAPLGLGGGGGGAVQHGGYGQPGGAYGAPAQPAPYGAAPQPNPYGGAAPAAAPPADPSFQPYWFSVPDQRQLVDANTNAPTASLNPGVWYLAVANHGQGIMVEVDGVRGVLWNVTGIQKSG